MIPYSGKFSRTINFAVFVDFTLTTKIISSKFLPEQVACLCDQIDCFTRVVTSFMFLYKYFAVKCKVRRLTAAGLLFVIVIVFPLLQQMEKSLK